MMRPSGSGERTPEVIRRASDGAFPGILRGVALIAVVAGATVSMGLMLRAGHPPLFLRMLFVGWVLSPFMALVVADLAWRRWPVLARPTLHGLMLMLTLGSLAFYRGIIPMPPASRPAALFLLVPLGSWLLLTITIAIAKWRR